MVYGLGCESQPQREVLSMELFKKTTELKIKLSKLFPYVLVDSPSLGGHSSLIIKLSLDKKEDWLYDIFHNSRYAMFHVSDGKIELFSKGLNTAKMRKGNVSTIEDVIKKVTKWKEDSEKM